MKTMKAITLFGAMLISMLSFAQSPGFKVGTRIGVGTSDFETSQNVYDQQVGRLVGHFGINSTYQLHRFFGIEADILLDLKGSAFNDTEGGLGGNGDYAEYYRNSYVSIPIYPKISVGSGNFFFKAYAGPSFNFLALSTRERVYDNGNGNDGPNRYSRFDKSNLGYVAGLGIEVETGGSGTYYLELRTSSDLNNVGQIENRDNGESANVSQNFIGVSFGTKFGK